MKKFSIQWKEQWGWEKVAHIKCVRIKIGYLMCVYVIKCMCVCFWTYPSWLRAECCMFWIWCCCHPLIEPRCRVLALLKPDIEDRSALLREYSKRKHRTWVNICILNYSAAYLDNNVSACWRDRAITCRIDKSMRFCTQCRFKAVISKNK